MSDALIPVVEAAQSTPTIGPVYWNVTQGTALSSSVSIGSYSMLAVFVIMRSPSYYDYYLGFRITPGGSPVYSSASMNAAGSYVVNGTTFVQFAGVSMTIPGGASYNGSTLSLGMGSYVLMAICIVPVKWS